MVSRDSLVIHYPPKLSVPRFLYYQIAFSALEEKNKHKNPNFRALFRVFPSHQIETLSSGGRYIPSPSLILNAS